MSEAVLALSSAESWAETQPELSASEVISLDSYTAPRESWIPLAYVEIDGRRLTAERPVRVRIESTDDGALAESDALQIYAFGASRALALQEFRAQLFESWTHYHAIGDDDVIGDAARLRRKFINNFTLQD